MTSIFHLPCLFHKSSNYFLLTYEADLTNAIIKNVIYIHRATVSEAGNLAFAWTSSRNAVGSSLSMNHLQQRMKLICIHLQAY